MKVKIPVTQPWEEGNAAKRFKFGFKNTDIFSLEFMVLNSCKTDPLRFIAAVKVLKPRNGRLFSFFNRVLTIHPANVYRQHVGGNDKSFHLRNISTCDLKAYINLDTLMVNTKYIITQYGI